MSKKKTEDDWTLDKLPARIQPGEYDAICYKIERGISFGGREDLYFRFRIQGLEYHGTELYMVCHHADKRPSARSKFTTQWTLAAGRRPERHEPMRLGVFKNKLFTILVRDSKRKFPNGKLMPAHLQYSMVDSIIEPQTGVPIAK